MKIHVDKIPSEWLELAEQIDPQSLFLGKDKQGISFTKSIDVKANVTKTGSNVFVDLAIEAPCESTCSRCLAKVQDNFKKKFSLNYDVKPGDILEIDEDIRQEIILDYPMKVVCKPDCKGLCQNCGQDLNTGTCDCSK